MSTVAERQRARDRAADEVALEEELKPKPSEKCAWPSKVNANRPSSATGKRHGAAA